MQAVADGGRRENELATLFRIPIFRRMWAAITLSSLGDWLGLLANTALLSATDPRCLPAGPWRGHLGVILVRLAPDLLLGPFAAAIADKFDRRRIAIIQRSQRRAPRLDRAELSRCLALYRAVHRRVRPPVRSSPPSRRSGCRRCRSGFCLPATRSRSSRSTAASFHAQPGLFALLSSLDRLLAGDATISPHHISSAIVIALLFGLRHLSGECDDDFPEPSPH